MKKLFASQLSPVKEQSPYLWLQENEREGKASCGCLLGYDEDGSAQFTFCKLHEAAPYFLAACHELQDWLHDDTKFDAGEFLDLADKLTSKVIKRATD